MTEVEQKTIGIFALQGAFIEHQKMIEKLGVDTFLIRSLSDVKSGKIDGIILPGGESTTMKKLLSKTGLDKWLIENSKKELPIFGTCAGMIILADFGLIDVEIERNAYGGQLESFETALESKFQQLNGIFIRAPKIKRIGDNVEVIAKHGDVPVLVRQKNILIASFHPELTDDERIHEYFLGM